MLFFEVVLKVKCMQDCEGTFFSFEIVYTTVHLHKSKSFQIFSIVISYNFLSWQTPQIEPWINSSHMPDLLRYHIVSCEELRESDLKSVKEVVTSSGYKLRFSVRDVSTWSVKHIFYFRYWIFLWIKVGN